jgi:hypothetical protein
MQLARIYKNLSNTSCRIIVCFKYQYLTRINITPPLKMWVHFQGFIVNAYSVPAPALHYWMASMSIQLITTSQQPGF